MQLEENKLRDLLSNEAEKERRAYKRATRLIAITALVGLFWLGFSSYKVVKLERASSQLSKEIERKKTELNELDVNVKVTTEKLVGIGKDLSEAEETLKKIAAGTENPKQQAEDTLHNISIAPLPSNPPISIYAPKAGAPPPFLMPIEDVFSIQWRGSVATGRVVRGTVKVNDPVEIVGIRPTKQTVVIGVEMFKKVLDEAVAGDNVGLLLRGVERRDIERGQVIAKPGSIKPHTKFKAKVDMLEKEKGGRLTPFFTGYRPQFYFRTTDVSGVVKLQSGRETVR